MKVKIFLLAIIFLLFCLWEGKKENNFLVFCNVGQGDGALLMAEGKKILIDTGPANKQMSRCLEKYLPFWDKAIDIVMISHWDTDHSGGLEEVLKYYEVKNVFCADYESNTNEQRYCSKKLKNNDMVKVDMINFDVLSSGAKSEKTEKKVVDDNENSLVMRLNYMGKKILFAGDIPKETEERLVWREILNGEVDILKVSHHGSGGATSETLLEKIKPAMAVISVGKNSFGHPNKELIQRLERRKVKIFRTDLDGDIKINF